MKIRQISCASLLALAALAGTRAQADTTYDISFTDTTAKPTFGNASGTFTINGADQITSFKVTFKVLKAYTFGGASGSAGGTLTFNGITGFSPGPIVSYNPATEYFGPAYNSYFYLDDDQTGNATSGVGLNIYSGQTAYGRFYDLDPFSGEFSTQLDTGTWSVSPASVTPPTGAPEPAPAALLIGGVMISGVLLRRRTKKLAGYR
jgi:hypothetical protein